MAKRTTIDWDEIAAIIKKELLDCDGDYEYAYERAASMIVDKFGDGEPAMAEAFGEMHKLFWQWMK